jgi:N-acyl-phosphatidylethanolamine-hydrolysing phospholipase D
MLRWLLSGRSRARSARRPIPQVAVDPTALQRPVEAGTVRTTWLGHSAVLLQYAGGTILTDPMLGRRASPLPFGGPRRMTPLPMERRDLPRIDAVLLSHNHYDHLHEGTVRWLHRRDGPRFVVPAGLGATIRRWLPAARIVELDWGESHELDAPALEVHCTPARHFSRRTLSDWNRTLWASYFLAPTGADPSVFFAGDSGYAPHFGEIRERLGRPDLALIPIGAYEPRWIMRPVHLNPEEAVRAALDVGAGITLGIHWGVFILTDEPMDEPPRRFLAEADLRGLEAARVLPIGATLEITAQGPS